MPKKFRRVQTIEGLIWEVKVRFHPRGESKYTHWLARIAWRTKCRDKKTPKVETQRQFLVGRRNERDM